MTGSVSLTLQLHHNGRGVVADVTHVASNTVVRCHSLADLMRVIHEHGDTLRPTPTGQWDRLLAQARSAEVQDEASLSA